MQPVASAWMTKQVSSQRKSRASATMRSWSRRLPAPGCGAVTGARRVPTYALTTPTRMITAIATPITR